MDNKFVGPGGAKVGGGADTDKLNIDSIIARLLEGKYVFFCLVLVFISDVTLVYKYQDLFSLQCSFVPRSFKGL